MSKVLAGTENDLRWKSPQPGSEKEKEILSRIENLEDRLDEIEETVRELQFQKVDAPETTIFTTGSGELRLPDDPPLELYPEEDSEDTEEQPPDTDEKTDESQEENDSTA